MPIRIECLPDYVHVSWYGKLASQDLVQLSVELARTGLLYGKAPNALHTFDDSEGMGLPFEALAEHGKRLAQIRLPNPSRSASVCHNPLAYGMARMMQTLNQNPDLLIEVFSDETAARRWLTGQPAESAPAKAEPAVN